MNTGNQELLDLRLYAGDLEREVEDLKMENIRLNGKVGHLEAQLDRLRPPAIRPECGITVVVQA